MAVDLGRLVRAGSRKEVEGSERLGRVVVGVGGRVLESALGKERTVVGSFGRVEADSLVDVVEGIAGAGEEERSLVERGNLLAGEGIDGLLAGRRSSLDLT